MVWVTSSFSKIELNPYIPTTEKPRAHATVNINTHKYNCNSFFFIYKYLPFSLYILFIFLLTALGLHCCAQAFV